MRPVADTIIGLCACTYTHVRRGKNRGALATEAWERFGVPVQAGGRGVSCGGRGNRSMLQRRLALPCVDCTAVLATGWIRRLRANRANRVRDHENTIISVIIQP